MINSNDVMISTLKISINTMKDISKFVETAKTINAELDLKSGRYIVDAKSIMGIFSLDLSKPLGLSSAEDIPQQIYLQLQKYEIKD